MWRPVLGELERHHEVLALTLPGHFQGPPLPRESPSLFEALVDWLEAELDRRGIGRAHVVGSSLGGSLALEIAGRGRAHTATAFAPIGLLEPPEARRLTRKLRASSFVASHFGTVARLLARSATGRRFLFGDVLHRPEALSVDEARGWFHAYRRCSGFAAITAGLALETATELPRPSCPVSIVWPADDRMTPAEPFAHRFARALPAASHARIGPAGHIPMSDTPDQVVSAILRTTAAS